MSVDSTQARELISGLKWYFQAKNLALKNALSIKCPLSVDQQNDIRTYYSLYLANLLSATEMLLENEYPFSQDFKQKIKEALSFPGFTDGENNYSYLRELRNAVIHRGFDICSSAHIKDDMPLMIAPQTIANRSGKKSYSAFGFYLLEMISKCESVIGHLIEQHLQLNGLLKPLSTHEQMVVEAKVHLASAVGVPEWVKNIASSHLENIDHEKIQLEQIKSFVAVLHENALGS
ncbi:hypothetical protein [Arcobacter sp. F2176]|uniref:hypothetical protein n=1 Tax=Arcobacter sp. F2176 TaxID=2044511 RepID=UPI00100B7AF9|nr:hypothetical protein [Arcobacter sp. F2176]RXJ79954.1 hypothetical protein CRU95_12515 [Arcobacter sp. F2176]